MERLKKFLRAMILPCLTVTMLSIFTLQADAANITYNLSDMTSSNSASKVNDNVAYSTVLAASSEYKLPKEIHILSGDKVLSSAEYTYSPTDGKLTIRAESVQGDITIMGAAVKLKSTESPTVKGNFVVYETLSAVVSPADATVTYQWYRGKKVISGATGPTYTLTLADIGQEINVQITGIGDFGGQKISTTNTLISKKKQTSPSKTDVVVTNVTKNGGTDGTIVVDAAQGMEYYDTVSTTWRTLPARNKAAGEYQIRFKETSDALPSESITVRIFEPCTAPVPTDVTITHLTTAGASTGKMTSNTSKVLEYYNGTAWVTFPVQGLRAGKYQVRFAEATDYLASAPEYFFVKEPTTLVMTAEKVTVTHVTVKGAATGVMAPAASNAPTMEVLVDDIWKTLPFRTMKAGTYQVRYAATDTTFPSDSCNVVVKEPADPPTDIKVTDVTTHGGNNGAIRGLKTSWQVSYDGKVWNDCTQTTLTGLSAGNYYFRTKETEQHLASAAVMHTVKQPEATPEATIDYINGMLKNLVANAQYRIDSVEYTADKLGQISIHDNNLAGRSVAIVKKGDAVATNDSAKQTLNIPARPATPDAPMIMKKTDTTVTVAFVVGLEYSIDGKTWMTAADSSYTFAKLRANTAYTVFARVKAIEGKSFTSSNAGTSVTTKKSSASAAPATRVTAVDITDTTITVNALSGQEYRIDSGEWIVPEGSTYTFTKLTQNTRYTIQTRTAETADTMPGATLSVTITTFTKLTVNSTTVDFFKMAITDLTPGNYSINGSEPVIVTRDGLLDVEAYFGRTVMVRRLGSAESKTVNSDPVSVSVVSPVDAPTAEQASMTNIETELTKIILLTPNAALEYQLLNGDGNPVSTWKSSDGGPIVFEGLTHSTPYLLQASFKPTTSQPKSNARISGILYTKFYEETPEAVVDTVGHCLTGLVPGAKYVIGGVDCIADAKGSVSVEEAWIRTTVTVVKRGDGDRTVDSAAQELTLPDRHAGTPTATGAPVTYHMGDNGAIENVTDKMEYSADGGQTWIAITDAAVKGVSAKDYLVRFRAVAKTAFAGVPQTVTVTVDTALADYKQQAIAELEQAYAAMEASQRYSTNQLSQIRTILDSGIDNINTALNQPEDIDNAKKTVLENMNLVPCTNTSTADGQLVGEGITENTALQYPNDTDAVWGNVRNENGLNPALLFVIQKLGRSDTEALREQLRIAIGNGTVLSTDESISAATLAAALEGVELKLGLDITLSREATPTDSFDGVYTVTMLLPTDLQGISDLNVISVGADGTISYHPATVTGNYLTFQTTHFSTYGVIGEDSLALAKSKAIDNITDLSNQLDSDRYTRENWKKVEELIVAAIGQVGAATTEEEVDQIWVALLNALNEIPVKKSLGWLWLVILLIVLLIALVIACYLVWRVRYFDGEEQLLSEFHFWHSKVVLYAPEKDGYVLEGWYHDPELTDRAENDFPMPWHTVKLYAKWNLIEILSTEEPHVEEVPAEEPMTEAEEAVEVVEETTETEETEAETVEASAESEPDDETPALDAPVDEVTEYEENDDDVDIIIEENDDDEAEDDIPEVLALPQAEDDEEDAVETTEEEIALLDAPEDDDDVAMLDAPEKSTILYLDVPDEEAVSEEDSALLGASPNEGRALLGAPEEGRAVLLLGEVDDNEPEEEPIEDDGYKSSDSYRAWLRFGEGEITEGTEEITTTEDGDEVQLFVNEKTGEKYHIRFNLSFRAKMTSLSDEAKGFYRELKDEFLTYKGVKTRISWKAEAVRRGRETLARFAVRDKMLCIFLALDPEVYRDSKYVFESMKDIKAYETIPMMIRVKSDLSCRKVKELIADMMEPREVKRLDAAPETDYSYLDEDSSTEARLRAGQLRIWAEGPDDAVCANRAAAATLHYLVSPETTAEEAEALVSDEMLNALMPPAQDILIVPDEIGEVSIEQLCKKFYVGDEIDIAAMKDKGLIDPETTYVKITASEEMSKKLTVNAHMFERTAAKMILVTGGDIRIIQE